MIATLADLDARLDRYRHAADTIGANLLELDRDPNRQLLDQAPLRGTTADAWADARTALSATWDWYARFTTFVDRAAELRVSPRTKLAAGRERQLADFLDRASIELRADEVALRDRDLLQARVTTTHCTGDELLTLMSEAFGRVRNVVVGVAAVWNDMLPRVTALQGSVAAAVPDAGTNADLASLRLRLEQLTEAIAVDPLSVSERSVAALERDAVDIGRANAAAREIRDHFEVDLRDARTTLEAVERAQAAVGRAHADARAKVVLPELPAATDDPELAAGLEQVGELATAGRWRAAQDALTWRERAAELQGELDAAARAVRARVDERAQLRGRLDAYSAQAHAFGLDEDPAVTDAHDRAAAALYTAPTDLDAAAALVFRYQQLVSDEYSRRKGMR